MDAANLPRFGGQGEGRVTALVTGSGRRGCRAVSLSPTCFPSFTRSPTIWAFFPRRLATPNRSGLVADDAQGSRSGSARRSWHARYVAFPSDQYRITGVQEFWFRRSAVIVDTAEEAMSDKVVELPNGVPRDFGGDQKEKYQGTDLCSICDRQFMDDVTQLKALRSYLIRQAKSPEPGTVELGDLNLLRFDEKGRYPTDAEWRNLRTPKQRVIPRPE